MNSPILKTIKPQDPSRRKFIKVAAGVAAVGLSGASISGCQSDVESNRQLVFKSLDEALIELDRLTLAEPLTPDAGWNWARTLNHCAQSIEFSMTGFPEPKSALFQRTVGATAISVFAWRGRMTHSLTAPIPGAPSLAGSDDVAVANARLRISIEKFKQFDGEFRPHFAYGALNKAETDQAQAMHVASHFSLFQQKA